MSRVRKEPGHRKLYIFLSIIVLTLVLLFATAQGKYKMPFSEKAVTVMLAPFQGIMMKTGNFFAKCTADVWELMNVYQRNKALEEEVEQLRDERISSTEVMAENERLKQMLDYKQAMKQFDLVVARVAARDSENWTNSLVIDRGSRDGIRKDMAVVTPQGLVGNIEEVYDGYSKVHLIIDPRNAVGGIVQRPESRVAGIVIGDINNRLQVRLTNIPRDAELDEGDNIVTSGFGGMYPKGIMIGTVEKIENDQGGLLKYAIMKPAVNFQKLEEVSVIVQSREAMPEPLKPLDQQNDQQNENEKGQPKNGGKK